MSSRLLPRVLAAAALACAALYVWEAGQRGLLAGSESRYAEISRAMLASGDWLTPRYYGLAHLHKPPVVYWLTAAGFRLLGVGEAGARLFLLLAAFLGVLGTAVLGRLSLGRRAGNLAAGVLASSGLWLFMGQNLTTDMYLSAVTVLAYLACLKAAPRGSARGWSLLFWLCLGLSFLIKAQAGILVIGFPVAAWAWLERRRMDEPLWLRLRVWPDGILIFCATALPWYLILMSRDHELLRYWVVEHVWKRFFSENQFQRGGPFYYYLPVLAAGLFPWTLGLVPALKRAWREDTPELRLFALWFAVPFVFFSASKSKLPPYVLPLLPALALILARHWDALLDQARGAALARRGALALGGAWLLVAAAYAGGRLLLPAAVPPGLWAPVLAMGCAAGLALAAERAARGARGSARAFAGLAVSAAFFLIGGLEGARRAESSAGSLRPLAPALRTLAGAGYDVAEFQMNTASLPFYLGKPAPLWREHVEWALWEDFRRETAGVPDTWARIRDQAGRDGRLFVLARTSDIPVLAREPVFARLVARSGPFSLLVLTDREPRGRGTVALAGP